MPALRNGVSRRATISTLLGTVAGGDNRTGDMVGEREREKERERKKKKERGREREKERERERKGGREGLK